MFEVGDKVRYVPNERRDSYQGFIGRKGTVVHASDEYLPYPYRVEFDGVFDNREYFCSEAELVKVGTS